MSHRRGFGPLFVTQEGGAAIKCLASKTRECTITVAFSHEDTSEHYKIMLARFLEARKAKRRGTNEETEEENIGARQRDNLALVKSILAQFDANQATQDNFKELFSPNADINFTDTQMNVTDLVHETKTLRESFPDLEAEWDEIIPLRKRDVVVVNGFVLSGTHTGQPYAFGPFPTVPTKGASCRNDPERLVFRIFFGKIQRIDIVSNSEKTGPQGFYRQLGGYPL